MLSTIIKVFNNNYVVANPRHRHHEHHRNHHIHQYQQQYWTKAHLNILQFLGLLKKIFTNDPYSYASKLRQAKVL